MLSLVVYVPNRPADEHSVSHESRFAGTDRPSGSGREGNQFICYVGVSSAPTENRANVDFLSDCGSGLFDCAVNFTADFFARFKEKPLTLPFELSRSIGELNRLPERLSCIRDLGCRASQLSDEQLPFIHTHQEVAFPSWGFSLVMDVVTDDANVKELGILQSLDGIRNVGSSVDFGGVGINADRLADHQENLFGDRAGIPNLNHVGGSSGKDSEPFSAVYALNLPFDVHLEDVVVGSVSGTADRLIQNNERQFDFVEREQDVFEHYFPFLFKGYLLQSSTSYSNAEPGTKTRV